MRSCTNEAPDVNSKQSIASARGREGRPLVASLAVERQVKKERAAGERCTIAAGVNIMTYISKAEQDQHNWFSLHDAILYVALCDGCSADDAARQIIRAVADEKLRGRWGRNDPANPASFSETVTVYLGDGKASVYVDNTPPRKHCAIPDPKIEIVKNVFQGDDDFSEHIPDILWLAREDVESIWRAKPPQKTPNTSQRKATPEPKIRERLNKLAAECQEKREFMPNMNETWDDLYKEGIRSKRRVFKILREDEFKRLRRQPGKRK
jgi:hypothetical protein